eukprot:CAMPEP_0183301310 /NCGR_PEP_ID=MMETSP0160_2-20130417/7471_1 /TAXON_ID=2839 ORGANISM="Odontella Sinensis, Strain Grunow 1884" /NCGR_SAMPLE_ID=MMETSP0160_2 /ASSEMBLY_ACC=CAM_ASM_000250 /LENGTH=77 /DNA_ID=CAMNT_0025463905 /DNA_START=69 /DNA_END=299 /DNA_ORIENTATION=+
MNSVKLFLLLSFVVATAAQQRIRATRGNQRRLIESQSDFMSDFGKKDDAAFWDRELGSKGSASKSKGSKSKGSKSKG